MGRRENVCLPSAPKAAVVTTALREPEAEADTMVDGWSMDDACWAQAEEEMVFSKGRGRGERGRGKRGAQRRSNRDAHDGIRICG